MINKLHTIEYRKWFQAYSEKYLSNCKAVHKQAFKIKIDHTLRVCQEIINLGKSINLSESDIFLLETTALFHDIGRFEQYARFNTFVDAKSVNHAELGRRILIENNVFSELNNTESELILRAISYHNRITLPVNESEKCLLISRLLRDADKLDIWQFVIDYYLSNKKHCPSIELDLPDDSEVSSEAIIDFLSGNLVKKTNLKRLNDFKLLKISWIYDINFLETHYIVRKRKYIDKLIDLFPDFKLKQKISSLAHSQLDKHICLPSHPHSIPLNEF